MTLTKRPASCHLERDTLLGSHSVSYSSQCGQGRVGQSEQKVPSLQLWCFPGCDLRHLTKQPLLKWQGFSFAFCLLVHTCPSKCPYPAKWSTASDFLHLCVCLQSGFALFPFQKIFFKQRFGKLYYNEVEYLVLKEKMSVYVLFVVCVCMCACTYVYVSVHDTCMAICVYVYVVCVCICICYMCILYMYVYVWVCVYTYICMCMLYLCVSI
jgi:hypothetical protein